MGPKKYLGQHFLTAPAFAKKIAEAVEFGIRSSDGGGGVSAARVLEIGPGRGALSAHLAQRFPAMHFVEIDRDAVGLLKDKLGTLNQGAAPAWVIHNVDVMGFDFSKAGFPLHVVGNLPYNIGARIIKKTLMYAPDVLSCTFMVQREVAARVVSGPHSRENGWLSVFCRFFGGARILFHVPPGAFFPRPNVDSSVFQIIVDKDVDKKLERGLWNDFFSFVDAGFSMRRKQLAKTLSLKLGRGKEFFMDALLKTGADAAARPEDLDAGGWLTLYKQVRL